MGELLPEPNVADPEYTGTAPETPLFPFVTGVCAAAVIANAAMHTITAALVLCIVFPLPVLIREFKALLTPQTGWAITHSRSIKFFLLA
jgi:hypothetical protein